MLDLMRKNAGTWMVKFILGVIIIVFTFWGVGSWRAQRGNRVAMVNDKPVTLAEYRSAYNNLMDQFRQRLGTTLNEDLLKALRIDQQAMDQVINQKLLLQEAARCGLRVSDSELARSVRGMAVFKTDGTFDTRRYKAILSRNRMTPEEFELGQRESLLIEKLRRFMTRGVKISDQEARAQYDWNRTSVDLEYVLFDPEKYVGDVSFDETAVDAYFQTHQEEYKIAPMARASYVRFVAADFQDEVVIEKSDIEEYYESKQDEFNLPETVEASHILFRLEDGASEAAVAAAREKADVVWQMARDGEEFAELAKKYSEGPSRDSGGHLGEFKRGMMVKPFEDKAFSMMAGEVGEPVRTRFGWHIIKVGKKTPAKTMTLAEVEPKIRIQLTEEKAKTLAYDAADAFYQASFDGDDLKQLAAARQLTAEETGMFSEAEGPEPGVPDKTAFAKAVFSLPLNEISDIQELADGFYIVQAKEKVAARVPSFEAVAERVKLDWQGSMADEMAKLAADKLVASIASGTEGLAEAAKRMGLTVADTGPFQRNGAIPDIGYEPAISTEAFLLTLAQPVSKNVVKGTKGYYVIELKHRTLPADGGYEKEKETIVGQLLAQKQRRVYEEMVADVRSKSVITITEGFLE
jgi:peptidyl-prolyl cis-trans isomerase D